MSRPRPEAPGAARLHRCVVMAEETFDMRDGLRPFTRMPPGSLQASLVAFALAFADLSREG